MPEQKKKKKKKLFNIMHIQALEFMRTRAHRHTHSFTRQMEMKRVSSGKKNNRKSLQCAWMKNFNKLTR